MIFVEFLFYFKNMFSTICNAQKKLSKILSCFSVRKTGLSPVICTSFPFTSGYRGANT